MDFYSLLAPRIAAERKRLKLSQEAAASACGISREMWGKYERGKAIMGGEVLCLFSAAGADVRFIITGNSDAPSPEVISTDERYLLDRYRGSPQPLKDAALRVLLGGEAPKGTTARVHQQINAPVSGGVAGRDLVHKERKKKSEAGDQQ